MTLADDGAVRRRADHAHEHRQLARQGNRPHPRDGHRTRPSSVSAVESGADWLRVTPPTARIRSGRRHRHLRRPPDGDVLFAGCARRRAGDDQRPGLRAQDVSGLLRRARAHCPMNAAPATVIAVDGPAASGKGTVAAGVARALGFHYLDSGSLYRLVALQALRTGTPLDDETSACAPWPQGLDVAFRDGAITAGRRGRHRGHPRRGRLGRRVAGGRASGRPGRAVRAADGASGGRPGWWPTAGTWAPSCSRTPSSRCS